ncbi:polyketide synthase [Streptomyces luteolifulvus]|jgi:acyl carrier protein|uniref:Polyketide synthase n=1 Tax=Streptomyces luteolifulvus TaxID=2615112 RepID=A0A6H9UR41_9ACTN|nr:acyl carrier protein [Streptomyces luteolifulvus]KAB1140655.1 polyketide synthase [Streptomyces luteolifulvus]
MSIAPETRTAPRALDRPLPHGNACDLEVWLTERVAFHLHRTPDEIDPDTPLADYGIDSVAAISICGEIEEHHRLAVAPTIAYDFPTVHEIAGHLAERLADRAKPDEVST